MFGRILTLVSGAVLATSVLFSQPAQAVPITGGVTSVALTSASDLANLGISVSPLGNASLTPGDPPVAAFPITGGDLDPGTGDAIIAHDGSGLRLSNSAVVDLENFLIDTAAGILSGLVTIDGGVVGVIPIFDIGPGLALSLTDGAADALELAFQLDGIQLNGFPIGTASVSVQVPEPSTWLLLGFGAVALMMADARRCRWRPLPDA